MGKRSNFERKPRDFYPTPKEAVIPLLEHLDVCTYIRYAEPCCGAGDLISHITDLSGPYNAEGDPQIDCYYVGDIEYGQDALKLTTKDVEHCDYIITNPPWTRNILHPMIDHFRKLKPTWLLMDASWSFTKQARPFLQYCSDIVVVGRVKWIPDSKYTGKDDCCWYKFVDHEVETRFINK